MAVPAAVELVDLPERGRRFSAERRVRWGDADRTGRLRLDAIARYLQDVANDDSRDAGFDPSAPWVVRRTLIAVDRAPRVGEMVTLTTFSGGHGSRWAERRTSLRGSEGGRVETAALWIFVDPASGRPARLTHEFHATYDEVAGGRAVSARLHHSEPADDAERRPWPLRATDLDALGHVNNAATWAAVEDELACRARVSVRAELEYPNAIGPVDAVELVTDADADADGTVRVWLVVSGAVHASAVVGTYPAR
ncbi:acyl-[acyl-carrier-protein] thioesterase [soil metagenome]